MDGFGRGVEEEDVGFVYFQGPGGGFDGAVCGYFRGDTMVAG